MKDTVDKIKIIGIGEAGVSAVNDVIRNYDNKNYRIPKYMIEECEKKRYDSFFADLLEYEKQTEEKNYRKKSLLHFLEYRTPPKTLKYSAISRNSSETLADTKLLKSKIDTKIENTNIEDITIETISDMYVNKANIYIEILTIDDINSMDNEKIKRFLNETDLLILSSEMSEEIDEKITLNIAKTAKDLDISTIVIIPESIKDKENKIYLLEENTDNIIMVANNDFFNSTDNRIISENTYEENKALLEKGVETIISFILDKGILYMDDIGMALKYLKFGVLMCIEVEGYMKEHELVHKIFNLSLSLPLTSIEKSFVYITCPLSERIEDIVEIFKSIREDFRTHSIIPGYKNDKKYDRKKISVAIITCFPEYDYIEKDFSKILKKKIKKIDKEIQENIELLKNTPFKFFKVGRRIKKEIKMLRREKNVLESQESIATALKRKEEIKKQKLEEEKSKKIDTPLKK